MRIQIWLFYFSWLHLKGLYYMNKIKLLSQQNLSLMLAVYIGVFLNISVFYRRFDWTEQKIQTIHIVSAITEVMAIILFTFFLMRLISLGGQSFYRIIGSLLIIISVAASYYMTFFNVVIGYGIVASVMTTDVDLTREVVGSYFFLWMFLASALPLLLIWKNSLHLTLLEQFLTRGQRIKPLLLLLTVVALVWLPIRYLDEINTVNGKLNNIDMPSYGGIIAHSYLPSNWLTALGLFLYTQYDENLTGENLFNPAEHYTYIAPANIGDIYVVFIIGETTRWDHMGILGYNRNTTPQLAKEKNLISFQGTACDTSTKLSLRCMFVREGGVADNPQRTVKEKNIFAVLKSLGFSSELFAMQSEVWFYKNTMVNNYSFREIIAAEKHNHGKRVDDMLLINELKQSLERFPDGKHLVILHTKGSHYLYTQRYPRSFAHYQPECMSIDSSCTKQQLINSFDNSVLYTDKVISSVIDQVRDKKALVFYAADHGESIDNNSHFHGTPRLIAPQEQFRVPLIVWASNKFLADSSYNKIFTQLRAQQQTNKSRHHQELFDTVLGCLGYTSPNGGIVAKNNWCETVQVNLQQ